MNPERWQIIEEVFDSAMGCSPRERPALLAQLCKGDTGLKNQIETLISMEDVARKYLRSAVQEAAQEFLGEQETSEDKFVERIGNYRLLRELGRGGMGAVFLATRDDGEFRQQVALKLSRCEMNTKDILRRFRNERQILAALDHPFISRLLDGGATVEGLPYFVMEYVKGKPLLEYCDEQKLSMEKRLKLFRQICSAVNYAHQNLIIHRDIKPSNILVTADGTPKLLDFGIAKSLGSEVIDSNGTGTRTEAQLLTPEYASPEQLRGEKVTTATDVYSLGVVLYELLTGHRPFRLMKKTPLELMRVICEEEPERPSTIIERREEQTDETRREVTIDTISQARDTQPDKLRRQLSGDLDNILLKALRKEPERRYSSVEQFSEDIRRHLEELPVIARPDTAGYRARKFIARNRFGVLASTLAVLSLIIAVVATLAQNVQIAKERDRAAQERDTASRERERAERVSAFLADVFKVSSPSESRGNEVKARELLDKAAQNIGNELKDQPEVQATLMATMGEAYANLGLHEQAIALFKRSLETRRRVLGKHPDVASSLADLGLVLSFHGEFDSAEPFLRESLEMRRELFGNEQEDVANSLGALSSLMYQKNNLAEAERLGLEAMQMRRRIFGAEHPKVAVSLETMGAIMYEQSKFQESENYLLEAIAMRRKLLGNDHPDTVRVIKNLAVTWSESGKENAAEPLYREVIEARRKLLPAGHPEIGYALIDFGALLVLRNKAKEAEPMLREGLEIVKKSLAPNHLFRALGERALGRCLLAQKRYSEAELLLLDSFNIYKSNYGIENERTQLAVKALAEFYEETNKPQKAAQYRALLIR